MTRKQKTYVIGHGVSEYVTLTQTSDFTANNNNDVQSRESKVTITDRKCHKRHF